MAGLLLPFPFNRPIMLNINKEIINWDGVTGKIDIEIKALLFSKDLIKHF